MYCMSGSGTARRTMDSGELLGNNAEMLPRFFSFLFVQILIPQVKRKGVE